MPPRPGAEGYLLTGTPGESLALHIVDTTHHLHNISIPDQGVNVDIPVDGAVDVVVPFPAKGPTVYFWSYHDTEGQAGELFTVSPQTRSSWTGDARAGTS